MNIWLKPENTLQHSLRFPSRAVLVTFSAAGSLSPLWGKLSHSLALGSTLSHFL